MNVEALLNELSFTVEHHVVHEVSPKKTSAGRRVRVSRVVIVHENIDLARSEEELVACFYQPQDYERIREESSWMIHNSTYVSDIRGLERQAFQDHDMEVKSQVAEIRRRVFEEQNKLKRYVDQRRKRSDSYLQRLRDVSVKVSAISAHRAHSVARLDWSISLFDISELFVKAAANGTTSPALDCIAYSLLAQRCLQPTFQRQENHARSLVFPALQEWSREFSILFKNLLSVVEWLPLAVLDDERKS